ncbi:MAG TPA: serine/threonine-protein kinase [Steroidobacteraceae bacterium]|nr:serine/threonine-protein kinase [Steroidobacteraceae bacterium]
MTPERWERLRDAFHRVVDSPLAERDVTLKAVCGDDAELRREVEAMLASDVDGDQHLRKAIGGAVANVVEHQRSSLIGSLLGGYRVTGVLGHGGMGTVYLAERADRQFHQRVAIKLVEQMAVHPQLRTRLRAERQILANLEHPYIAHLIDGGENEAGIPYLVIEYIDGLPIDEYCRAHKLSIRARLQLFEKVCAAVDYAHRNLIVHRDLKPANILVTPDGTPKLLDFGIAKLLAPEPTTYTLAVTRLQDRLLTPEHAAPEQVLGRAITIATDVYALGVLLYQLLCDRSPYALHSSTLQGLERAICNEDPPRPGSLFRSGRPRALLEAGGFDPQVTANERGTSIDRLRRALAGDVDEIVLKAMRKEPEARYATAALLAADLRRHLDGELVTARQGSGRYRAYKFVRRHAAAVSVVSIIIVALMGFAVLMWTQQQQLKAQRDLAARERDRATQVSTFMVDIFSSADPFNAQGREATASELLERGAAKIQGDLNQQPEVRAQMLDSIGYAYQRRGNQQQAIRLLEQSLQIRRQSATGPTPLLVTSLRNLADALRMADQAASAEGYYRQALVMSRELFGERDQRVADVMVGLGRLLYPNPSHLGEAEQLLQNALAIYREKLGPEDSEVAATLSDLGNLMLWKDDLARAEQYHRQALQIYQATVPRTHPDYAQTLGSLGYELMRRGSLADAERVLNEALDLKRQVFGAGSPQLSSVLQSLADLHDQRGELKEAMTLEGQALAISQRTAGERAVETGVFFDSLARLQWKAGMHEEARRSVHAALSIYGEKLPAEHPYIASSDHLLGEIHLASGDARGAIAPLRHALDICVRTYGADSWRTARSQSSLGEALSATGDSAEAEPLLIAAYRTLQAQLGSDDELTKLARKRVLKFLTAHGRAAEADRLLVSNSR